ncbi:immunity 50 family protein [Bacillus subtilis]|uniref:immunity 50 family protein n=1 Tax=Bacillus subtilis TaxID=1423 RepID=UPI002ADEB9B4|nr:immunity 50 family protein [Bacillus subtilis]MEA1024793.1 immunity 50 family protein [Bacillus subtilis]
MIIEEKFMNPQAIINIFGSMPNFTDAELMNVELNRDGPCLFVCLMTKDVVENKPKRWGKWDVVYVEMSLIGVQDLLIKNLGTNNIVDQFEISELNGNGSLKIKCNNQMQLECLFDWARIENITPGLFGIS